MAEPHPFPASAGEELASSAYRYRKWSLNAEEGLDIVVRCELDAALEVKGEQVAAGVAIAFHCVP